jgi:hypothetical protein
LRKALPSFPLLRSTVAAPLLQRDFSFPKTGYVCNSGAATASKRRRLLIALVIGSFTGAAALAAGVRARPIPIHARCGCATRGSKHRGIRTEDQMASSIPDASSDDAVLVLWMGIGLEAREEASPHPVVLRAMPVARNRRDPSLPSRQGLGCHKPSPTALVKQGLTASNRCRMADSSITPG